MKSPADAAQPDSIHGDYSFTANYLLAFAGIFSSIMAVW